MARRGNFRRRIIKWRRRLTGWLTAPRVAALLLGVLGVLVGFGGYLYRYCPCEDWPNFVAGWEQLFLDFYANVAASLVTITIAVLTIDWLNERRAERQLKAQLIREMGSTDNGIAVRAANELRAHRWLQNGSLRRVDIWFANLEEANLCYADLRGVNLAGDNLQEAKLAGATLQWANLDGANLQGADLLSGAVRVHTDV
jgi:hypothetical protein